MCSDTTWRSLLYLTWAVIYSGPFCLLKHQFGWLATTIFRCRSGRYSLHTEQVWFGTYLYYNGAAELRAIGFGFGY